MKRVLVSGASGYIGRHTLRPLLERGFEVHAVSRRRPTPPEAAVSWHEVDLLDQAATRSLLDRVRATHLLHLAWYAEHGKFWHAHENLDWVAASLGLLRSFRAAGGERAVVAGTCAEFSWADDCCGPGTPLEPSTLYGVAKNALRQLVEAYSRSSGLSSAWGRVYFSFGPGERPDRVVASVARALVAGERVRCTPGTQVRDFLYVPDLADAFATLLDSGAEGVIELGSGEPVSLHDLLSRLQEVAGRTNLVLFGALPARDEPGRIAADVRRLREEIGWFPAHTLDEGLARTYEWWLRTDTHTLAQEADRGIKK